MASNSSDPNGQPLFIVDRDWLRQGSKKRKSWTGNVRNRSLYGLAIQVSQHDVPGAAARRHSQPRPRRKRHNKQNETTDSESQGESDSSFPSSDALTQVQQRNSAPPSVSSRTSVDQHIVSSTLVTPQRLRSDITVPDLPLSCDTHGLECVDGVQCNLDYYLDMMGTIQSLGCIPSCRQHYPARSTLFSLQSKDDIWTPDTSFVSTGLHVPDRNESSHKVTNSFMSSFLSQVNERVSKSDLSDGTIASVSCLALAEHIKGNDQLAKVHASGMAEMVRLRGGLQMIDQVNKNKIVRADLVRSADTLEIPLLPQTSRETLPLSSNLESPPVSFTTFIATLPHTEVSTYFVSLLWTTGSVCKTLEALYQDKISLDTTSCYQILLSLTHNLLTYQARSAFEEALRLSLINFVQPTFRYCAYKKTSCHRRATRLRSVLEQVHLDRYNQDIVLWMLFIGYMTSQQTAECAWFISRLAKALERQGISKSSEWSSLKSRLQKFLWIDCIHNKLGEHFHSVLQANERTLPPNLNRACTKCNGGSQNLSLPPQRSRSQLASSASISEEI